MGVIPIESMGTFYS